MSKNTGGSGRNQRNNPYQLEELFIKFHRTPAGIAWRWRTELLTLAALAAALLAAGHLDHPHLGSHHPGRARWPWPSPCRTPAGSSPGAPGASWPGTACKGCATKPGCTPAPGGSRSSLWTRPTKVGERTWVLCRAGICAEDFEAHIGELRAACYARDARVTRNRRWSHLLTIDIIRRDTLAAREIIASPLERLTAHYHIGQLELVPPMDSPPTRASPPHNPARRSPAHAGGRLPQPEGDTMTATDTRPLPPVPTFPFSMFDPVHLGRDEYGAHVHVNLAERNMLLGGEPGAGKSSGLNLITAHGALSHDCKLILVDGKQVELGLWRACADMFIGPSITDAIAAFEAFQAIMNARYDDPARRRAAQDHPRRPASTST